MQIDAYVGLHYGREWLEWALRSVVPFVDRTFVFYSDHPSHGTATNIICPETKEELFYIAEPFGVHWIDIPAHLRSEGEHRDYAAEYCKMAGSERILWVDSDEVWDPDDLSLVLDQSVHYQEREMRVRVKGHFWKSVNWVCRDECMPVRVINPNAPKSERYLEGPGFWHFGYAQSLVLVAYKMRIHGHRNEIRRNWLPLYAQWQGPEDTPHCGVHPTNECSSDTGKPFWVPVPFDRNEIAHLIGDHPYFSDKLI